MKDKNEGQKGRLRNNTWDDYGISKARYKELKYFCLQYKDFAKAATAVKQGRKSTGRVAEWADNYAAIQRAAALAAARAGYEESNEAIIESVTKDMGYEAIQSKYATMPFGRVDFYAIRRVFFYFLDRIKAGEEM